jgi:probable rRNA maturation factor
MILNRQRAVRVAQGPLELFLHDVCVELGLVGVDLTVCLVSDNEIARMNAKFRKKSGPTDVLSFPAISRRKPAILRSGKRAVKTGVELGDIAISPTTAKRYARKHRRSVPDELKILILHGVLHLLGYDHEKDHGEMNRVERRFRKRLGLA